MLILSESGTVSEYYGVRGDRLAGDLPAAFAKYDGDHAVDRVLFLNVLLLPVIDGDVYDLPFIDFDEGEDLVLERVPPLREPLELSDQWLDNIAGAHSGSRAGFMLIDHSYAAHFCRLRNIPIAPQLSIDRDDNKVYDDMCNIVKI